MARNQIADVTPLAKLTNLTEELHAGGNQIADIKPLSNLINLRKLTLFGNRISDVSPLASLTNLTSLFLQENQIEDIAALGNLTKLQVLQLGDNQISDISPLSKLTDLPALYLYGNQIQDISPLSGLTKIGELEDEERRVQIERNRNMYLMLGNNQISDISALVDNPGIGAGKGIGLRGNPLNNEAYDVHIPALQKRGAKVNFDPKQQGDTS
jgi:Leucine-rich repeat (LRR) protein